MNQRREPRFPVGRPVGVTVFGPPDTRVEARIRNATGRGLGLELAAPLATGAALKIEFEDSMLLGEVIYCRPQEGGWYAGVELAHALVRVSRVGRRNARIYRRTVRSGPFSRRAIHSPIERSISASRRPVIALS